MQYPECQLDRLDCPQHDNISVSSVEPGHPPSLIRVFAVHQWVAKEPSFLHVDSEDWSDWVDAQADLRFWVRTGRTNHFVGFVMVQLISFKW